MRLGTEETDSAATTARSNLAKPFQFSNGPLPSPTFIPSPPPHHATSVSTEFPTLGSLMPAAPPPSDSPSRLSGRTAIFSPSLHSSPPPPPSHPSSASALSLSTMQTIRQRRKDPLPRSTSSSWVNSDSDYVPLVPIVLIAVVSLYVFWLCTPSHQQFLSSFSSSPSHLTVFHHWQSPHNLPPLPHPSSLPATHSFVGRHQQLAALHNAVTTQHSAIVVGPSGSGRTALVHTYIDRYIVQSATAPSYNLILHLTASSIYALHADLTLLAASLQLPLLYPSASSLTATLQSFLAAWPRYLVVFDGVKGSAQRRQLEAMMPRRKGKENEGLLGDTIFIMDQSDTVQPSNQLVRLGGLGRRQCSRVLSAVSGVSAINETAVEAEELCGQLDGLPQAAVLAGLYMLGQQLTSFAAVTAAVQAARQPTTSAVQSMIQVVLALPAFNESLPVLSAVGRLTNYSSSVPAALFPLPFPLSLYVQYGLMWAPLRSVPYAMLHSVLFRSTETKTASVLLLPQLSTLLRSSSFSSLSSQSAAEQHVWSSVSSGGLVETLAVAALGQWMHRPFYSNFTVVLPSGAPSLSPVTLPALPPLSLSSWYELPDSTSAVVRRVWGGHSAPREVAYSVAQAAAIMPAVLAVLHPVEQLYKDVTLHITADSTQQVISVTPRGQSLTSLASQNVSSALQSLLYTAACYLADVHAGRQLSSRYLTIAAALALLAADHSTTVQSLLLLSVHHLLDDDHVNALSLLTYLHQRYIASSSPSFTLSPWLQLNILSALALAYTRAGDVSSSGSEAISESERLLQEVLTGRQQLDARSSMSHLLSCRDLLTVRQWQSATLDAQLNAQYACQRIEHSVFTASSYASSARLLAIAHMQYAANATAAAAYSLAAYETFGSVSASTADHRMALALVYHAHHVFTSPQPHSAMPMLDHLFLLLSSSFPRGLGFHTRPLLCVSVEVAAGLAVWQQGMEASRQGWEASRGVGDAKVEDEWKRMFGWLYQQLERDKAEEKRREEQARLDEIKRKQADEEEQRRQQSEL